MTVFDVYLNDQRVSRAGVGVDGVLSAIVSWAQLSGPNAAMMHGPWEPGEHGRMQVGGLRKNAHLSWVERPVCLGDRISVVIAEARTADRAERVHRRKPAQEKRMQRAYYQRLKEQFEPPGSPTMFLNVDLDLRSTTPLAQLLGAFGRKVVVLHSGKDGRHYRAHLELASEGRDPDTVVNRFVKLVERLPESARVQWNRARVREFNIGIQAGTAPHGFDVRLDDATVRAVARVNARIAMSVYGAAVR